jgi:hypothetical protein
MPIVVEAELRGPWLATEIMKAWIRQRNQLAAPLES